MLFENSFKAEFPHSQFLSMVLPPIFWTLHKRYRGTCLYDAEHDLYEFKFETWYTLLNDTHKFSRQILWQFCHSNCDNILVLRSWKGRPGPSPMNGCQDVVGNIQSLQRWCFHFCFISFRKKGRTSVCFDMLGAEFETYKGAIQHSQALLWI